MKNQAISDRPRPSHYITSFLVSRPLLSTASALVGQDAWNAAIDKAIKEVTAVTNADGFIEGSVAIDALRRLRTKTE